jgi:hypothetical protein
LSFSGASFSLQVSSGIRQVRVPCDLDGFILITLDRKKLQAKMVRFRKGTGDLMPLCGIKKNIADAKPTT